jgi:hypothetical protein
LRPHPHLGPSNKIQSQKPRLFGEYPLFYMPLMTFHVGFQNFAVDTNCSIIGFWPKPLWSNPKYLIKLWSCWKISDYMWLWPILDSFHGLICHKQKYFGHRSLSERSFLGLIPTIPNTPISQPWK